MCLWHVDVMKCKAILVWPLVTKALLHITSHFLLFNKATKYSCKEIFANACKNLKVSTKISYLINVTKKQLVVVENVILNTKLEIEWEKKSVSK